MGEGPYTGFYSPDSALKALFFGNAGAQQAVGAEHVSDIGVYYDRYSPTAEQIQQAQHARYLDEYAKEFYEKLRTIGGEKGRV